MKREDLAKLGLDDAAIDAVMALNGKAIEANKTAAATATAEPTTAATLSSSVTSPVPPALAMRLVEGLF